MELRARLEYERALAERLEAQHWRCAHCGRICGLSSGDPACLLDQGLETERVSCYRCRHRSATDRPASDG